MKRIIKVTALLMIVICMMDFCACSKENNSSINKSDQIEETVKKNTYTLQFDVYFETNLLFSTYDVEVYVDGIKLGTVKQGESFTNNTNVGGFISV